MMNEAIDWSRGVHDCVPSTVTFEREFLLGLLQNIFGLAVSLFTLATKNTISRTCTLSPRDVMTMPVVQSTEHKSDSGSYTEIFLCSWNI
jgi:hypothetical protein